MIEGKKSDEVAVPVKRCLRPTNHVAPFTIAILAPQPLQLYRAGIRTRDNKIA
jgi:hypothetical protein